MTSIWPSGWNYFQSPSPATVQAPWSAPVPTPFPPSFPGNYLQSPSAQGGQGQINSQAWFDSVFGRPLPQTIGPGGSPSPSPSPTQTQVTNNPPQGQTAEQLWDQQWNQYHRNEGPRPPGYHGESGPPGTAPTGPSMDDLLNAAAQGAYSQLATHESALRGQQPLAEQGITQLGVDQTTPFTQAQQRGQAGYDLQQTQTNQAQQNAVQQARQLFNELSQYNQSRFGSGSSAGPAMSEILSRATQQQFGNISNIAQNNIQQIQAAKQQLDTYTNDKINSVNQEVQRKLGESRQWFQDQLNQINSSRDTIESDKAAQRYQALRDRETFARSLQAEAIKYQQQIDFWRQTQGKTLNDSLSQYQQGMNVIGAGNLNNQANQFQQAVPRGAGSQFPAFSSASNNFFANSTPRAVRRLADGTLVDENGNPVQ